MMIYLIAPLLSMAILALGNGLYTTFTTLHLKHMDASFLWIGAISSIFFVGLMIGAYRAPKLAQRIGYIRAYTFYSALITSAVLMQGMFYNMWVWLIARFLSGYAFAGLFIVLESWILHSAEKKSKGKMLSIYLLIYYLSQCTGQLFLNIHFNSEVMVFCLIALFSAASILPVSSTKFKEPTLLEHPLTSPAVIWNKAPLSLIAGLVSGVILGSIYTIYPLYLQQSSMDTQQISWMMFSTILGGAMLQYPIGKYSDVFDRRKVLFAVLVASIASIIGLYFISTFYLLFLVTFLTGGFVFAIYPLAISHASDYLESNESIAAISILTIFYGIGSSIGPFIATQSVNFLGHYGFLGFIISACGGLAFLTAWRIVKRNPAKDSSIFVSTIPEMPITAEELSQQLEMSSEEVIEEIENLESKI